MNLLLEVFKVVLAWASPSHGDTPCSSLFVSDPKCVHHTADGILYRCVMCVNTWPGQMRAIHVLSCSIRSSSSCTGLIMTGITAPDELKHRNVATPCLFSTSRDGPT